jgi:hypothetical protein
LSKCLLLISSNPEDQAFGRKVAEASGLPFELLTTADKAGDLVAADRVLTILADTSTPQLYQSLEDSIQRSVGLFSDKINANAIHFLSSENLERVQYLVESPLFGHFILRNYGDPVEAGAHYGRIVKATQSERAFDLRNLLHPQAKIQVVKLQASAQKQDAVEAVKNYLLAARFQSRMATVVANAVDELLMNAMFDAPVDNLGKPLLNSTSRNTNLKLDGKSAVEMHVGYDGHYIAVTAVDQFGSLDKNKLLNHISKIYTEEEYKVKSSVAGAGIGLATVFRSGGSFFFVSESRLRTEVTVFFRRTDNFREFKDQFRFLSTQFYF